MDASKPIIFYDIASGPPVRTFAPNPWKTRYALNFKGVHYETSWVAYPEVEATRKSLGALPNRKFPDGSDFYTLPVIKDQSKGDKIVGDSFEIALYLDEAYPDSGLTLVPPSTVGLHLALNAQADKIFTDNILLFSHGMPYPPEIMDHVKKTNEARISKFLLPSGMKWEDMTVRGEARKVTWEKLKLDLNALVRAWRSNDAGPFLEGNKPMYADLIVGGWLQMARETTSVEEWQEMCSWHDNLWGRLHDGLAKYTEIK